VLAFYKAAYSKVLGPGTQAETDNLRAPSGGAKRHLAIIFFYGMVVADAVFGMRVEVII
jgi:hypothetical protein